MAPINRKQFIAIVTVTAILLSVAIAYNYDIGRNVNDDSENVISVESWSIESGSYYPWLWINLTDDLPSTPIYSALLVKGYYEETGECAFAQGRSPIIYGSSMQEKLNLQNMEPGDYRIEIYLNCTFGGTELPTTFGSAHLEGANISLPMDRPIFPQVLGIMLTYSEPDDCWHYAITIEDPDQDGDRAQVWVSNETGYSIYNAWGNNTGNLLTWIMEGDMALDAPPGILSIEVLDDDGPYAMATFHTW